MGKQSRISGARIVIETLIEQGVTDIFGYPGSMVLDIYDELYKAKDRINHYITAHEQGAAHAADGYARATGRVGVVLATSGPGATNLVTGIATAMLDSVPMVAITGNVATSMIGRDSFQEINITGITMPITKHNYFVSDISELADTIREAFRIAKSGRPGPVLVDIPKDVQLAMYPFEKQAPVKQLTHKEADPATVEEAVRIINAAKRPYIYIGGGAAFAGLGERIKELAERIDAYIGCTLMGLSAIETSYNRFLGLQGMHGLYASSMANKEADVVIGLGIRFSDRATGNIYKYKTSAKIIQLDIDQAEINKNVSVDVGVIGDIVDSFERIAAGCEKREHPEWGRMIAGFKAKGKEIGRIAENTKGDGISPKMIFNVINENKGSDCILTTDVGQHQMWAAQYSSLDSPRHFISSGGLGTMGYGMGAACGAAIAGNRVLLITGDGSFAMNLNELVTAVSYNLPVTVVIMNNTALGLVRQWQTLFFDKRYAYTEFERRTDFVKVAEGFGVPGVRVTDINAFAKAFKKAMKTDGPYLIDACIDRDEFVLPMLPPNGTMDDLITTKGRKK